MVSTRKHPSTFTATAADDFPVKRVTRSSKASTPLPSTIDSSTAEEDNSADSSPPPQLVSSSKAIASSKATPKTAAASTRRPRAASVSTTWSHTPSVITLGWLAIAVPLVIWDCGYVLLRPHSMPGGKWHAPWKPYALYATVDYNYGFPAIEANNGFTGAQAWMNVIETVMYVAYLGMMFAYSQPAYDAQGKVLPRWMLGHRRVVGRDAAFSLMVVYSALVMTVAKTMLYVLNEACSGYAHVGHNDTWTLITLYLLPNGPWIFVPSYLVYVFGKEIIDGLEIAAGLPNKKKV